LNHQRHQRAEDHRGDYDRADLDHRMQHPGNYMDDDDLLQIAADDVAKPQNQCCGGPEFRLLPELSHRDPSVSAIFKSLDCRSSNVNVKRAMHYWFS
jgi:hypothetical protein